MAGGSAKRERERPRAWGRRAARFSTVAELAGSSNPTYGPHCVHTRPPNHGGWSSTQLGSFPRPGGALAVPSGCSSTSIGSIGRHLSRLLCISLCFILEVSLPPFWRLGCPNPSLSSFGHRRSPTLLLVITLAGRRGIFRSQKKLRLALHRSFSI